ncbi:hypothetical protein D3C71_2013650 [compost metagenome]
MCHSSNSILLKQRWFDREAWIHMITTKRGLETFMKKYVEKEVWSKFRKDIMEPFIEGEMVLEVSY